MEQNERIAASLKRGSLGIEETPGSSLLATPSSTPKSHLFLRRLRCTCALQPEAIEKLENNNVHTVRDLLARTVWDVHEIIGTSTIEEVRVMLEAVAKEVAPAGTTAKIELLKNWIGPRGHLRTCIDPLDSVLYGGVRAGVITEIVGPAGLGKTQFCLQMSVIGCLEKLDGDPGGRKRILYMDTEKKLSAERLSEIAKSRFPENFAEHGSMQEMLERIIVQTPSTTTDLLETLQNLPGAIIADNIVLIIIDSIASMFRSEFGSDSIVERQKLIGLTASTLKSLAESFNIPVVVTNQITTKIEGSKAWLAPALGTAWSHAVNTRLTLSADVAGEPGRSLCVSKSSFAPSVRVPYTVTRKGLEADASRQATFVSVIEGRNGLYTDF